MNVVLVGPNQEENLSLGYLSSSLRAAGHEVGLAPFNDEADGPRVLDAAAAADLVGLSMAFQIRAPEFQRLARALKERKPSQFIVAGGHFASCAAGELLRDQPQIDAIVIHEGERTLVEIADSAGALPEELANIPGIAYRRGDEVVHSGPRPCVEDLDELPWPDRDGPVYLYAGVPTAHMLGSRGCL